MRVGSARLPGGARQLVLREDGGVRMLPYGTLREAFEDDWRGAAFLEQAPLVAESALDLGPVVEGAAKVICVGHNYRNHILEMGHELPEHPNVFSKFPEAMVGPRDDIELSTVADLWDWEAELAVVISRRARHISEDQGHDYIGGYTVANDVSARDWQRRSTQWLLGKTFANTTPVGAWMVTADELDLVHGLELSCSVDGVEKQRASTADLVFGPEFLVSYLSQVLTLEPGDVVLTGTPGGVGAAREPVERLHEGQVLRTTIVGIGELENRCVVPSVAPSPGGASHVL